jgi:hypothetical protein
MLIYYKHDDTNFSPEADAPTSPESAGLTDQQLYDEAVCDCPDCLPENATLRNNPIRRHRPESDYIYEI